MKKKTLFALLLAAVMLLSGCSLVLKDSAVDAKQTIIDVNGEQVDKQTFLNAYNYTLTMQQYYAQMLQQFGGDGTVDEASILQSTLDNYISSLVLSQKAKELGFDQFTDAELAELQAQAQEEYDTQLESIRTTYFADSELEGDALTAEVTAYAKANGDLLPSATYRSEDGFGLGDWVRRMRTARAENDPKLTEDRIRRLDAIGMKW